MIGIGPIEGILQRLGGAENVPLIPPTFEGSRVSFALVLFGLMMAMGIAVATLLTSVRNVWVLRGVAKRCDPINVNRYVQWSLLLTILTMGLPDLVTLLAYGESSRRTMQVLLEIDRTFDALSCLPLLFGSIVWVRAKQVIHFQLIRQPIPVDLWPTLQQMVPSIRIAILILVISVGVAIGK